MLNIQKAYAAWNTDDTIRMKSSSGGMFGAFVQEIFKNKGIVYCVVEKDKQLIFIRATEWTDIELAHGSKYYQADATTLDINTLFKDIKDGHEILLIGTSCQSGMFYSILEDEFKTIPDNVVLIDIICHGTASKYLIDRYRTELSEQNKSLLIKHEFRSKIKNGIGSQYSRYIYDNGTNIRIDNEKDRYMQMFFSDLILRPSCYKCSYAGIKKLSDISIGDFNGSNRIVSVYPDNTKSISAVITNTDKGDSFLQKVFLDKYCEIIPSSYDLIAEQNLSLLHPSNLY